MVTVVTVVTVTFLSNQVVTVCPLEGGLKEGESNQNTVICNLVSVNERTVRT